MARVVAFLGQRRQAQKHALDCLLLQFRELREHLVSLLRHGALQSLEILVGLLELTVLAPIPELPQHERKER
jgi:hypothetical protein